MLIRSVDIESYGISGDRTLTCTFDATSEDMKKINEFARKHLTTSPYGYPDIRQILNDSLPLLLGDVDGRKSGRYPWGEYVNYMVNDEKAVKTAMWEWKITPKKVIFNGPATIVIWQDGTKTIVKKSEDDTDDREKAVMYAILKKEFGNRAKMNRYLKQFKEVESDEEKAD